MKNLKLNSKDEKLSEKDYNIFIKKYNLDLPISYKQFILNQNGGRPEFTDFLSTSNNVFSVILFYPIRTEPLDLFNEMKKIIASVDMIESNQIIEENLPKEFYPFACDSGDNVYCISMDESRFGEIYKCYWDGSDEIFMCASFEEFIDGLGDYED